MKCEILCRFIRGCQSVYCKGHTAITVGSLASALFDVVADCPKITHSGAVTSWSSGPLLGPGTGLTPPFGANGVQFNNAHTILYVADTAYHQIIQIPVNPDGSAGTASVLITGINAPDGIMVDNKDNIWICSNQEDEIVVIDKTGTVIAKLGDFRGIDQNGIAQGLLFPASLAFSKDRSTLYVSKLTLYLPYAGADLAIDSQWTLQVKGYTASKLPAVIPPFPDRFH
jgi:SMP-30/Gluconolactonase/LRE-like region